MEMKIPILPVVCLFKRKRSSLGFPGRSPLVIQERLNGTPTEIQRTHELLDEVNRCTHHSTPRNVPWKSPPWSCKNTEDRGPFCLRGWDVPTKSCRWCSRWHPSLISGPGPELGLVSHENSHSSPSNGAYKPGFLCWKVIKSDKL